MAWTDETTEGRLRSNELQIVAAGYRSDFPHALRIHYGCGRLGLSGASQGCPLLPTERALPRYLLADGDVRVIADQYFGPSQGVAFGFGSFLRSDDGVTGGAGRAGQRAGSEPRQVLSALLWHLGYLGQPPGETSREAFEAALQNFQEAEGLTGKSYDSLRLLGDLIVAARRRATS